MSSKETHLVIVFDHTNDHEWLLDMSEEEREALFALASNGVHSLPGRKEEHLSFVLTEPLNPLHMAALARLRDEGMFTKFYVRDEVVQ